MKWNLPKMEWRQIADFETYSPRSRRQLDRHGPAIGSRRPRLRPSDISRGQDALRQIPGFGFNWNITGAEPCITTPTIRPGRGTVRVTRNLSMDAKTSRRYIPWTTKMRARGSSPKLFRFFLLGSFVEETTSYVEWKVLIRNAS